MQIPGTQARTSEDRDCEVRCSCGHVLVKLTPGMKATLAKPGRRAETTCPACGKKASTGGAPHGG